MPTQIKKRILFITPFCRPSVGGAETHLDDLCEYLRTHHYFVYVLTYQPITIDVPGEPLERKKNLEIHRFNWIGHNLFYKLEKFPPLFNFLYLTPYLFLRSFLFMLTHKNKVDVIHAQGLSAAFIVAVLKRIFNKRVVMSTMALYCFKKRSLFSRVSCRVLISLDKIFAETEESRDELISIGVPQEKITVFSHWVDQDEFKPRNKNKMKKELGWQGKFIVLFVGRAIPIKGADTLIEVAKKIDKNIYFVFISDAGPQLEMLRRAARTMENVIFVGGIPYKELYKYYNATDVFVIPSRYEEGAARVMLEALSSGLPIIGSNRGAIPSILNSSIAISLDPNVRELKKSIEFLYHNPNQLLRLANNARSYALEKFSLKNVEVITNNY